MEGLGKRFGSRWLFRGVSFTLKQGDALVVLGPNGSGKSTFLRIVAGLGSASEGTVSLPPGDSRQVLALSALEMSLYPNLSVAEHLEFSAGVRGCAARTGELLDRIGLTDAADRHASQISTGMKARLKLAMAIQANPAVLLLDEPGAGLDEHGLALVESIAAEQRERGCLILATNEPRERRLATLELRLAN